MERAPNICGLDKNKGIIITPLYVAFSAMKMIKQLVEKQNRIPSPQYEPEYLYSKYWWKTVAYNLLL